MTLHSIEFDTFQGPGERVESDLREHLNDDPDGLGAFRSLIFAIPVSLALWTGIILGLAWVL